MTDEVATVLPPSLVDALVERLGHAEAPPTDLHRPFDELAARSFADIASARAAAQ